MKSITIIVYLISFCFFLSCKQPWPSDSDIKAELENGLNVSDMRQILIKMNGEYAYNNILNCIVRTIKDEYPDYSDYQEAFEINPHAVAEKIIPCMITATGENTDILWKAYELNPEYAEMKESVSEKHFQIFKKSILDQFKSKYGNMTTMLKKSIRDRDNVNSEISDIFLKGILLVEKLIEKEEKQLEKMESLFDTKYYDYGVLTFVNNNKVTLKICLGYYYRGSRWSGWTSHGWWSIEPGERINIHIPSTNGYLNRYFYYYAYGENSEYSGKDGFVVSGKAFKIPNADKIKANDFSDFYYLSKFRKVDLGETAYSHYTYNLN